MTLGRVRKVSHKDKGNVRYVYRIHDGGVSYSTLFRYDGKDGPEWVTRLHHETPLPKGLIKLMLKKEKPK